MKKLYILGLLCFMLLAGACKKPAGKGGNSSITGSLLLKDYKKDLVTLQYQGPAVDADVYIIYGDDISYGDKIKTNGNGEYEFKYLRKGNYRIYAISTEQLGISTDTKDVAVEIAVSITDKKQVVDAGQITIKK